MLKPSIFRASFENVKKMQSIYSENGSGGSQDCELSSRKLRGLFLKAGKGKKMVPGGTAAEDSPEKRHDKLVGI